MEESRKPKHTHFSFLSQNNTFVRDFSSIKFWRHFRGWQPFDLTFLLTFLLCFWYAGQIFSIAKVHTCLHLPAQEGREQVLQKLLYGWVNL